MHVSFLYFVLFVVRIGQETLTEENLADDDIEIELAPIAVQLAYVHQVKQQHRVINFRIISLFFFYPLLMKGSNAAATNVNYFSFSAPWSNTGGCWSLYRYCKPKSDR